MFDGDWARAHPYPADSSIYGDRPVMRAALAASGSEAYLAEPVCRFRLGGSPVDCPVAANSCAAGGIQLWGVAAVSMRPSRPWCAPSLGGIPT
ncbi:hypothetical protein [Cyanobium sp. ATX-6F1]|uniref:hypothetical protein n=1 Tax=Cyanobium sp. ATX-6F1 TaxID=3137388 RepID=UPI0039BDBBA9